MECADFSAFQESLRKMRDLDDKIVYALNIRIPTTSFRNDINPSETCKEFYDETNYKKREQSIKRCIDVTTCNVRELKEKRDSSADSMIHKNLSKEQNKLRILKSELLVEEVVKDRSLKLYHERCREYYTPGNLRQGAL